MPEPPPEEAIPKAISRTARAAIAATASVMGGIGSIPPRLVAEAEEVGREVDAHDLELLDELGADAGRLQPTLDLALDDAGLLEHEHVLHDDHVAFHALHFGDVRDPTRSVLQARLVDDEVDGRCDLLTDGAQGQVDAGHEDHCLEP